MGKSILIFIVTLVWFTSIAQTNESNQSKYWFYRYRLTNEFLKKGESACGVASGFSIPSGGAYNGWPRINFGDGTSFLGYYIGVLAMEYRLLANSGVAKPEQLARTKQELYYAMKAYERLDRNAELFRSDLQSDCSSNLNGFFLRDDVDIDTYFDDGYFKTPLKPDPTIDPQNKYKNITSNFNDSRDFVLNPCSKEPARFVSQDQISDLFVGFALVQRCMEGEFYYSGSVYYDFADQARRYTDLITHHLETNLYQIHVPNKNDNKCNALYGGVEVQINSFGIAKAGEGITEMNVDGNSQNVVVGFSATGKYENVITALFSDWWQSSNGYPGGNSLFGDNYNEILGGHNHNNAIISQFAAIGNSWKVGLVPYSAYQGTIKIPWPCSSVNYSCESACLYCSEWSGCNCRTICYPDGIQWWDCPQEILASIWCYNDLDFSKTFRDLMIAEINKILPQPLGYGVSALYKISSSITPKIQMCAPFQLPEISVNTTALSLSEYGNSFKIEPFALLHKFLYDNGIYTYKKGNLNYYLNTAPCTGPHRNPVGDRNNPQTSEGVPDWRVDNRWQKANESKFLKEDENKGAWPGLDYMFLHNLYALVHGGNDGWPTYSDALDVVVKDKVFPVTFTNLGSSARPKVVQGYESITCSNTAVAYKGIYPKDKGYLVLRAGNSVKLSNLRVDSGTYFRAYTNPVFTCDEITNAPPTTNLRTESSTAENLTMAQINDSVNYYLNKNKGAFLDTLKSKMATYTTYEDLSKYKQRNGDASTILARQETENLATISLYPNPANTSITFQLYGLEKSEAYTWILSDSYGQAKMSGTETDSFEAKTIALEGLQMGVYHIQIHIASTVLTQHFIKSL